MEKDALKDYLQECRQETLSRLEKAPSARPIMEIPGLNQSFRLEREQSGRILVLGPPEYFPIYEAVYESEHYWKGIPIGTRSMTKLIFQSRAEVNETPPGVEEILRTIPQDMLQYLIETLNNRWAVVTFGNTPAGTYYTINFDKSELWEQEESILDACFYAQCTENKALGPYCIVCDGTAYIVPGSTTYEYPDMDERV